MTIQPQDRPSSPLPLQETQNHGLLLINKPQGITSHNVVYKVRKVLRIKKVGHLGTLDPMADGILPLALGYATRLSSLFMGHDKTYEAAFRLGVDTDTHDRTGHTVAEYPIPLKLDPISLKEILAKFTGEIEQIPPMISAKKYQGKPLYYWIRKGVKVPTPPAKRVVFHRIELLELESPIIKLRIHCSAGAYVRGLARDLGQSLGCGAVVDHIRRVKWNGYGLADTITLDAFIHEPSLRTPYFIPMSDIEPEWPKLNASDTTIRHLMHGQPVMLPPILRQIDEPQKLVQAPYLKIFSSTGILVAIARIEYPNRILPEINIPQLWSPVHERA